MGDIAKALLRWWQARFRRALDLWISLLGVLALGLLVLEAGRRSAESATWAAFAPFLHEIGIACLIAVVLAILIELNVSRRVAAGSLDTVMRAIIPADVWGEIREHIVSEAAVREDYGVSMALDAQPRADGFYASTTTLEYTVRSLKDFYVFMINHELDNHQTGQEGSRELPKFLSLKVGREYLDEAALDKKLSANRFVLEHPIVLGAVGQGVPVTVKVRELVRVPDSFTWWMSVTTRRPTFRVTYKPANVEFKVTACHPRAKGCLDEKDPGCVWEFRGIMLPGQGFEIRTNKQQLFNNIKGLGVAMAGGKG